VIHAHRYPYGMMVRGRSTADACSAGLAAVTVLGPASTWMAGLRRSQPTPEPRLAPAPTLIPDLDRPVAQGPPVGVTVAATPSTSTPHPEALPATDE